mmetsp:Transcript_8512/g.28530  ORF Transcript_8512/g.28530 Transcript_8512/m.28530 type:complete len:229 (-) Transcript_8512:461-1147(-)
MKTQVCSNIREFGRSSPSIVMRNLCAGNRRKGHCCPARCKQRSSSSPPGAYTSCETDRRIQACDAPSKTLSWNLHLPTAPALGNPLRNISCSEHQPLKMFCAVSNSESWARRSEQTIPVGYSRSMTDIGHVGGERRHGEAPCAVRNILAVTRSRRHSLRLSHSLQPGTLTTEYWMPFAGGTGWRDPHHPSIFHSEYPENHMKICCLACSSASHLRHDRHPLLLEHLPG